MRQQRGAKVAAQHAADPLQIAQPAWLIQAELVPERLERRRRRAGPQNDRRDIARQHVHDNEHQDRSEDQADHQPTQPAQNVEEHIDPLSVGERAKGQVSFSLGEVPISQEERG